ncbi:MAG TPA: hypothetical protein QGG37_11680 [Chloroflexota bacterium]|nr:hypothetical protein [Chloroflexota bacterium]
MALSDAFARKQQSRLRAWPLIGPLLEISIDGFDPRVGDAVYPHYREADRDRGAELAAAALSGYRLAARAAVDLDASSADDPLTVTYHFTGFANFVTDSLDAAAEWLADVYEMMLARGVRPNLANKDFATRFALVDIAAGQAFAVMRPWVEEVYTRRRQVRYRNAHSWREEGDSAVASGLSVRPVGERQLGGVKPRRVDGREVNALAADYLEQLTKMLTAVFNAGADRLAEPRDREADIDWD